MYLLGTNTKLLKQNGTNYAIRGLTLAPHNLGGNNVCESATKACIASCVLWFVGFVNMMPNVKKAMLKRKEWFFNDRLAFEAQLIREITNFVALCKKKKQTPAIRLNVASDLDWSHIARLFPQVAFYDYTKVRSRLTDPTWPTNYELTYSRSEQSHCHTIGAQLRRGHNVAVIFDTQYLPAHHKIGTLPKRYQIDGQSFKVVDGDKHDVRLRSLDGKGVVVGLRFKGSFKRRDQATERRFVVAT